MFRLRFLFLSLFILHCSLTKADRVTPAPVTVLKCCKVGESLQAEGDDFKCTPGVGPHWAPYIYAPKKRAFLPVGTIPQYWKVAEAQRPVCKPPTKPSHFRTSTHSNQNFILFANGSLFLVYKNVMLQPMTFCVDVAETVVCLDEEGGTASTLTTENGEVSPLVQAQKKIRVKKCCGDGAAYSETKKACVVLPGEDFKPDDIRLTNEFEMYNNSDSNGTYSIQLIGGFPTCSAGGNGWVIAGHLSDSVLAFDGSLILTSIGMTMAKGDYCVERVLELDKTAKVFACSESIPDEGKVLDNRGDIRFTLYPIGLLISCAFLLATLVAGFLLPSSHHALHWRCQTHYIFCLLVGDLIMAITQLATGSISGGACVAMAILMHFFFLAAFFWLNTMCFNIWWTFRDFRPTSMEKRQEVCRLRIYEVFAWGGPLLIAGIAAGLDRLPPDPLRPFLRPRFGVRNCWFYGDMEILTFFFGPIGFLLAINLLLFASTARQLTCGLWKREDVKSTTERAALGRVCMKLVVVMGVTWVADVISWAVGGPDYVWYITDLINALQGVLIFIVVGCQPQVWAALKKLWCLKKLRSNTTNTTGAPMHSSSQGLPSMGDSVTNNTIAHTNTSNVKIPMETVC